MQQMGIEVTGNDKSKGATIYDSIIPVGVFCRAVQKTCWHYNQSNEKNTKKNPTGVIEVNSKRTARLTKLGLMNRRNI